VLFSLPVLILISRTVTVNVALRSNETLPCTLPVLIPVNVTLHSNQTLPCPLSALYLFIAYLDSEEFGNILSPGQDEVKAILRQIVSRPFCVCVGLSSGTHEQSMLSLVAILPLFMYDYTLPRAKYTPNLILLAEEVGHCGLASCRRNILDNKERFDGNTAFS
jgi:hypothetical protein